jgi:hypothetical protein
MTFRRVRQDPRYTGRQVWNKQAKSARVTLCRTPRQGAVRP